MAVVLFDFFGTLVDYDPSRTAQGYRRTHALLGELGTAIGYAEMLSTWDDVAGRFDAASDEDDHELSMLDVGAALLHEVLGRVEAAEVAAFVAVYLEEWSQGVRPIDGVPTLVRSLAQDHRLAVVTNTHSPTLVPGRLAAMGIAECFEAVVTSVEVGWRKPHPAIYDAALAAMATTADQCTFVGDTRGPDYDGPRAHGMRALLIDPDARHDIPDADRVGSVLDLPGRL